MVDTKFYGMFLVRYLTVGTKFDDMFQVPYCRY